MENSLILNEINRQNLHWEDENTFKMLENYKRKLFSEILDYLKEKQILSIIGLRRTGKTTY